MLRRFGPQSPRSAVSVAVAVLAVALTAAACPAPTPSPRTAAAPPPSPTRLAGDWEVTSTLQLREGLAGMQGQLLGLAARLRQVLDGQLELPGVPPFLARLAAPFVQQVIKQHVPGWARDAVAALGTIHERLTETRIEGIHTLRPRGGFRYQGHARWTRVTLKTATTTVTAPADRIPGLGALAPDPYAAEEKDGVLVIAPHAVRQRYAQLVRWAVEALLAAATCKTPGVPCLRTLRAAADLLLDCGALTRKLVAAAPALGTAAPLVQAACEAQKKQLLADGERALDQIALRLTYVQRSGEARIAPDGAALTAGRWFGTLGKAYGQGSFRGTFTARRIRSQ